MKISHLSLTLLLTASITSACRVKPDPVQVSGKVYDYYTQKPLPGIKLSLRTDEVTYTDEKGSFTLEVDKSFLKSEMSLSVNQDQKFHYQGLADEYLGAEVPVSTRGPSFGLEIRLKPSGTVDFSWPIQLSEGDTLRIFTKYDTILTFRSEGNFHSIYSFSDFDSATVAYYCFLPDTFHSIQWQYDFKDSLSPVLQDVFYIPNSFKFPEGTGTLFKTGVVRLK